MGKLSRLELLSNTKITSLLPVLLRKICLFSSRMTLEIRKIDIKCRLRNYGLTNSQIGELRE